MTVVVWLAATEVPAFACSCSRVESFSEAVERASVVVVGRLVSVDEMPPPVAEEPGADLSVVTVRAFLGRGMILAVDSVAKGDVPEKQIRAWDFSFGDCGNVLRVRAPGTPFLIALGRVKDFSAEARKGWGAFGAIPEDDYLASGGCTYATRVLSPTEHAEWINGTVVLPLASRKIP